MRYQASSWRGWTRTRRRRCQWGTKRRPLRSQTKSVSSAPGQAVLAGRSDEPVGDQHEGAVGEWDSFGPAEVLVKDVPEAQLIEQGADDEDRPPVRGIDDLGFGGIGEVGVGLAGEELAEPGKDLDQEIFTTEIGDDALFDLPVFAVGLDDADILVNGAA